jgi:hypothetical protein
MIDLDAYRLRLQQAVDRSQQARAEVLARKSKGRHCTPKVCTLKVRLRRPRFRTRDSREYAAYQQARQRCTNPNNPWYLSYGGRGIEFRFKSFEEFVEHIGLKPSPELSLDRKDNDGHYEKGNVRWATQSEQNSNKKRRQLVTNEMFAAA